MRIISATLRNYRLHRELSVAFDPARNLVGGANESGKSTLAEALHRGLFLRAKTGGSIQKEMVSSVHTGQPEVVLCFEAAGITWQLEKRFSAAKGSTLLTAAGSVALKDEEADAKLSEILKTESGGRANAGQLAATWSHLWVWQGSSGEDPAGQASLHQDSLVQRLQQDGIAAVMQSAADQRVREHIAAAHSELFTATGRPRTGSKPELARLQFTAAEQATQRAEEISNRLDHAIGDHARAEQEITEATAVLPGLRSQLATTEARLAQVTELRRHQEIQLHALQSAAAHHQQISAEHAKILHLQQQQATAHTALIPAEQRQTNLTAAEQTARAASHAADLAHRHTTDSVRHQRLHHDLALAFLAALEKSATHQQLAARSLEADAIHRELSQFQAELARLPTLSPKDLTALRKLDRAASHATATLRAMATGIELLHAETIVTLGGQPLILGQSHVLAEVAELTIGPTTRLRIHPGGGSSLAEARTLAAATQGAFSDALTRHTLHDLDHAATVCEQRQALEQQLAHLLTRWQALGGASLITELASALAAQDSATAELQRRQDALGTEITISQPASLITARLLVTTYQENLNPAESAETSARRSAEHTRKQLELATTALELHRSQITDARQALRDLETRLKVLEETHGHLTARQTALAQAHHAEQQASAELTTTRQALTELAPETLTADLDRLHRALSQQETRCREAEDRRIAARALLTLDGSTDPAAELSHARARSHAAHELLASEQRRAMALEKLHQLFSSSREAIDDALVQPLADRISGYLCCLFGPGTAVRINRSDTGITGLDLIRPGDPAFAFATLSGGAKEQVAAAARLAMAEILASDHDGCLPILFDDAFAYTDPARVQSLQRMLNLAALRGLQVIVLTCTPAEYSGFGAAEIRLS